MRLTGRAPGALVLALLLPLAPHTAAASEWEARSAPKEAAAAARDGDFRLVWGATMGGSWPFGLVCNAPDTGRWGGRPLELMTVTYSDNPEDCDSPRATCEWDRSVALYGHAYNRVLADRHEFPHRDVCRLLTKSDSVAPRTDEEMILSSATPVRKVRGPVRTLHEAARRGTTSEIRRMIQAGAVVDDVDPFGFTPLAWATARGREGAVDTLLSAGADPLSGVSYFRAKRTPLWLAIRLGRKSVVERMLRAGIMARIPLGEPAFVEAAMASGDPEILAGVLAGAESSAVTAPD